MEGAGVLLKRVFGYNEIPLLDPFLLLDHFGSDNPDDYIAGFPWHPHRGIETVTYMLNGEVEHGDSIGNKGVIGSGDIQWMTAGSGIIHQEMPKHYYGKMEGFQLWVNLPAVDKMMGPRYRDIKKETVPEVSLDNGTKVKIICGEFNGVHGPAKDIVADPEYLDVTVPAGSRFEHSVNEGYTAFAYILEGSGTFGDTIVNEEHLGLFSKDGVITANAGDSQLRFILISGKPIGEPIAWRGPIVMNTEEELHKAFLEYQEGTFIK
jgi:redox-sensitive bicupin YhaK (pirin superfamily)